jgi:hypothetical protein
MILSYSKGAYLLLMIDVLFIFFFTPIRRRITLILFILPIIYLLFIEYKYLDIVLQRWSQIFTIISDYTIDGSASVRVKTWAWMVNYLSENPLNAIFGTTQSIASYGVKIDTPSGLINIMSPESQYFDTLFRSGFIGLILELTIMIRFLIVSRMLSIYDRDSLDVYHVFTVFSLGLMLFLVFEPSLRDREFGIFVFFCYGLLVKRTEEIKRTIEQGNVGAV